MRTYILKTSLSSHTSIALYSPSGLSFIIEPDTTRATTLNLSLMLIARDEKLVDAKTGDVTSIISPSFIVPCVWITQVDVWGTVNESFRYDNNI